jgi:hypothetical protein
VAAALRPRPRLNRLPGARWAAGVAVAVLAGHPVPGQLQAQSRPASAGIELGLLVGRFPSWRVLQFSDAGVADRTFRTTTVPGATLALFPVRQIGIRATLETSGLRVYSEDDGFDVWRIGLEVRPAAIGPLILFAGASVGRLSHTNGVGFDVWSIGGGAQLRLTGAFSALVAADVLRDSDARTRGTSVQRTEVDLDSVAWRAGLVWRVVRLSW